MEATSSLLSISLLRPAPAKSGITVTNTTDRPHWSSGGSDHFEGEVWLKNLSEPSHPDGVRVLAVQFAPNARTNWHSHPGGQVLHVLSGDGVVVDESGNRVEISAGDTYTVGANIFHWHGSRDGSPMLHLSITSMGATEWGERVSQMQ